MSGLEIFFLSFILGFVSNYILDLKYLKYLRGETSVKYNDIAVILTSIIWGSPVVLFMYAIFSEIRIEDASHSYRLLIFEIIILIIQIVAVVLLAVFNLLTLPETNNSETLTSLLRVLFIHQ